MKNFFRNPFFSSAKTINNLLPKLQELEEEMHKIDGMENKVDAIIRLFQVISPLQDANGFSKEIEALSRHNRSGKNNASIEALGTLQVHIRRAGRSPYGMNRTGIGEEVTPDKVFLGNIFGLFTQSASYWMQKRPELEKEFHHGVSKDPQKPVSIWNLINDYQCGDFVKSHTTGILKEIDALKPVA